jgi:site-specific recombinase XerD
MSRKTFKNKFVTLELIEQINPINKKLVERFLREKSTRSSKTTIKAYESDSNIFMVWNLLNNENKLFTDVKKLELAEFFSFVADEMKVGSSRANRLRSFLSSLSIFIEKFYDTEYPNFHSIVLKTIESAPKELRREKTILSNEQVTDLLEYFSKENKAIACWLALAVFSGARFAELLRFTTDLLDENNTAFGDLFLETTHPVQTKGRGRSGKMLYKYIIKDKFMPFYKDWLIERERIMKENNQEHLSIFIKTDGTPATDTTARYWVSLIEKRLGSSFYPHACRHFVVTEFARKKIPSQLIQSLIGWSSESMVSLYTDLTAKDQDWSELDALR